MKVTVNIACECGNNQVVDLKRANTFFKYDENDTNLMFEESININGEGKFKSEQFQPDELIIRCECCLNQGIITI